MSVDRLTLSDQQWIQRVTSDPEFMRLYQNHKNGVIGSDGIAPSYALNKYINKIGLPKGRSFTMKNGEPALKDRTSAWTMPIMAAAAVGTLGIAAGIAAAGAGGAAAGGGAGAGAAGAAGAGAGGVGAGVGLGTGVGTAAGAGAAGTAAAAGGGWGAMMPMLAKMGTTTALGALGRAGGGSGESDQMTRGLYAMLYPQLQRQMQMQQSRETQLGPLYDAVLKMVGGGLPSWAGLDLTALTQQPQLPPAAAPRRAFFNARTNGLERG